MQFEEWVDEEEEDEEWDRWETYNLKARNKKRKFQERNKIYNEQAVDAMPVDDGEQLSLFDEDTEEKEVKKS